MGFAYMGWRTFSVCSIFLAHWTRRVGLIFTLGTCDENHIYSEDFGIVGSSWVNFINICNFLKKKKYAAFLEAFWFFFFFFQFYSQILNLLTGIKSTSMCVCICTHTHTSHTHTSHTHTHTLELLGLENIINNVTKSGCFLQVYFLLINKW